MEENNHNTLAIVSIIGMVAIVSIFGFFMSGSKLISVPTGNYKTTTSSGDTVGKAMMVAEPIIALGQIYATSTPQGANFYVNNELKGQTPITVDLDPGEYNIKFTKTDYVDYTTTAFVAESDTTEVSISLTSALGTVTVMSTPSNSNVHASLNDQQHYKFMGKTPTTFSLNPGNYWIQISPDGFYTPYNEFITLTAGQVKSINVVFNQSNGSIYVTSTPDSANLYVNNVGYGTTPKTVTLNPGAYIVKLTKTSYQDYTTGVSVFPGQTTNVLATLILNQTNTTNTTGYLTVLSIPSLDSVYVNGAYKGNTQIYSLSLNAGTYTVKIVDMHGYGNYTNRSVIINADTTTTVKSAFVSCYDSDGGLNYNVSGYAETFSSTLTDYCQTSKTLSEAYCSSGSVASTYYNCTGNCTSGRCI